MSCEHPDFTANVSVNRLQNNGHEEVYAFAVDVTVACTKCGEPFGWRVPRAGMAPDDAYVSADGKELHVYLLSPADMALMEGPAGLAPLPPLDTPGYRISVR